MRAPTTSILLALLLLSFAVRLPYFAAIPAPTDETDAVLLAFHMAHDGEIPLTGENRYLGPQFIYLAALIFRLLGPSFEAARAVNVVLGALLAPAIFLLVSRFADRRAGVIAGLLAALSFGPVILGSHVFWSHGSAPLFVTVGLAGLVGLAKRPVAAVRTALVAGAGIGLALAAHPTTVVLWPGPLLWWLATSQSTLARRAKQCVWLALGAGLAYLPNLLFVWQHGFRALSESAAEQEYVGANLAAWPVGIVWWLESVARNLVGPSAGSTADARTWLGALLIVAAVAWCVARRRWLPVAVLASGALLMPLMLDPERFRSFTGLRYAAPAVPALLVALGAGLAEGMDGVGRRRRVALTLVSGIALIQVVSISGFYRGTLQDGVTGAPVLEVARGLVQAGKDGHTVFVDKALDTKLGGGGEVGRAVKTVLTLADTSFTLASADKMRWFLLNARGTTLDFVLAGDTEAVLGTEFALEPVRVVPVVPGQVSRSGDKWGWYRYRTSD